MDCPSNWEYKTLVNELTQGIEHTKQLREHFHSTAYTSENQELLLQKILSSYEQSLLILKWSGSIVQSPQPLPPTCGAIESSVSVDGSPKSDDMKRSFQDHHELINISKKRKSQPTWTEQVKVSAESGFEGPTDDGYSWRKYGQKDILGAKYPRSYYRCTYRHMQNCWATKQVQRLDDDPTVFDITYRGFHNCRHATYSALQPTSPEKQEFKNQAVYQTVQYSNQVLMNLRAKLRAHMNDLDKNELAACHCTFPTTFSSSGLTDDNRHFHTCIHSFATKEVQRSDDDPTAFEIVYKGSHTCHLATNSAQEATSPEKEASHHSLIVGGYSPSFVSPKTPESNYFSVSSCQMNGLGIVHNLDHSESYLSDVGIFCELRHSDSDRTDTFSANTSTTSSSIGGQFAILSGARHDFSIWTKRHPQTEANTPKKNDKDK